MESIILDTGICSDKVFKIPISYDSKLFKRVTSNEKLSIRQKLNIPKQAVVVGSFQKDGVGWGNGDMPKLIKGPDVFLKVISQLYQTVPELYVLLTGPARGFVKNGLNELGIPYSHHSVNEYQSIGKYYNALDAYIVTSREEGGPRSILECMASGIPIVSTQVGQATDLIEHNVNGWLTEVNDSDALTHYLFTAIDKHNTLGSLLDNASKTASENSYAALLPNWRRFMTNFVNPS